MDNLPHLKLMPIFRLILHLSRSQEVPLCPSSDLYGAFLFLRFDIEQQVASNKCQISLVIMKKRYLSLWF